MRSILDISIQILFFTIFLLLQATVGHCVYPTFSFEIKDESRNGTLTIIDIGNGTCSVEVENMIVFDKNTSRTSIGTFKGEGHIEDGSLIAISTLNKSCKLKIKLSKQRADVLSVGDYTACDFGFNGSVDGDYYLKSDQQELSKQTVVAESIPKKIENLPPQTKQDAASLIDSHLTDAPSVTSNDRIKLGIRLADFQVKRPDAKAAKILAVEQNGLGAMYGLQPGDIIFKAINKTRAKESKILSANDFVQFVDGLQMNDLVDIFFARPNMEKREIKESSITALIYSQSKYPNPKSETYFSADGRERQNVRGQFVYEKEYNSLSKSDDYFVVGLRTKSCTIKFDARLHKYTTPYRYNDFPFGDSKYLYTQYKDLVADTEVEVLLTVNDGSHLGLEPCVWADAGNVMYFHNISREFMKIHADMFNDVLIANQKRADDENAKRHATAEAKKTPQEKALDQCYRDCFGLALRKAHAYSKDQFQRQDITTSESASCRHECDLKLKY